MTEDPTMCEMPAFVAPQQEIVEILKGHNNVAIVGISTKPDRDSHNVARYLMDQGYNIIPVNPTIQEFYGIKAYPSLKDIPEEVSVEVIDIFRKPEAVPEIVEEGITRGAKVIWMQEGIINNAAAQRAKDAGLRVVMNSCMLKEHRKMVQMDGN